jgi:hypothetical protein
MVWTLTFIRSSPLRSVTLPCFQHRHLMVRYNAENRSKLRVTKPTGFGRPYRRRPSRRTSITANGMDMTDPMQPIFTTPADDVKNLRAVAV